jgi:hypothetical protein
MSVTEDTRSFTYTAQKKSSDIETGIGWPFGRHTYTQCQQRLLHPAAAAARDCPLRSAENGNLPRSAPGARAIWIGYTSPTACAAQPRRTGPETEPRGVLGTFPAAASAYPTRRDANGIGRPLDATTPEHVSAEMRSERRAFNRPGRPNYFLAVRKDYHIDRIAIIVGAPAPSLRGCRF